MTLEDLKCIWLARPAESRAAVLEELEEISANWRSGCVDKEALDDADTLSEVVRILEALQ